MARANAPPTASNISTHNWLKKPSSPPVFCTGAWQAVGLDELRAVFGDELTETQLLELLSKADQDGDGVVTPTDLNEAARKVRERSE